MGNYLKFFEKESDYDIFKESDDFILPNISYTDDTETLHFNTLFIEPEKPKVTLRYNATADNLLAFNNSINISALRIDGTNIEFEPFVNTVKTIDVIGSQIQIVDPDNMIVDSPSSFFIDSYITECRFKPKDPNATIMGLGLMVNAEGMCMLEVLPMEFVEQMGFTIDPVTNEFIVGADLISEINNMMSEALVSFVFVSDVELLDTEIKAIATIGGLETPYYFTSPGEHIVEIETESGVFGGTNMFSGSTLYGVEIGDEIAMVEEYTFVGCDNLPVIDNIRYADTYLVEAVDKTLSTYVMKNNIKWIGSNAFSGCTNWSDLLVIPSSVVSIGNDAFYFCSGLTGELVIPNKVTSIGNYAFNYCIGLTGELVIPNLVTSIGNGTFSNCTGLTSVSLGRKLISIGTEAFHYCTGLIGELVIPDSVTSIGFGAFYYCRGLTGELVIPDSVTNIGYMAFYSCEGFTSLLLSHKMTSISMYAFTGCAGLTSVVIPNSVKSIGDYAFYGCYGLTGELVIPDSVTSIGNTAFTYCTGLTSLELGSGLTTIGEVAFALCTGLIEITCHAVTAPTIFNSTFVYVGGNGVLYYPSGSDYSSWLSTEEGYLGNRNWIGETF